MANLDPNGSNTNADATAGTPGQQPEAPMQPAEPMLNADTTGAAAGATGELAATRNPIQTGPYLTAPDIGTAAASPSENSGGPQRNRVLVPLLVALVVVLLAVIAFLLGRGTAPGTAAPATPATTAEQATTNQDQNTQPQQQAPTQAEPITDPRTLELVKSLPRRQADDPMALGPVDAPVVITLWEDFSCPMCTKFELESFDTIRTYADEGKVRIEWRDLAIFAGQHHSDLAAVGARAAAKQGKFWEFVRAAYHADDDHPDYDEATVTKLAQDAGVPNMEQFAQDFKDPALLQAVQEDTQHAQSIGIGGTPAILVGDAFISGAYPTEFFVNTINDRIAAHK